MNIQDIQHIVAETKELHIKIDAIYIHPEVYKALMEAAQ
jgi:hypothetical protein